MVTLRDALTATLSLDAVEASFVQAAELIRLIENSSVDRRGGASYTRSDLQLTTEDREQVIQSETVIRDETTYFRVPADQTGWMHLDLPRPALGALAALTVLYGADLTKPITQWESLFDVEVNLSAARERVPTTYADSFEDVLLATQLNDQLATILPEQCAMRVSVAEDPLHISELLFQDKTGSASLTYAVEAHPVARESIHVPDISTDIETTRSDTTAPASPDNWDD